MLYEAKDLAKFRGKIHKLKRQAIDTAAAQPAPVTYRRKLEKESRKKLDDVVGKLDRRMNKLHRDLESDKVEPARFKRLMAQALRDAYFDAYMLGSVASGLARVDDLSARRSASEANWIKKVLKEEGKHFEKFLRDMIHGVSRNRVKKRIADYSNAIRSTFDAARVLQLPDKSVLHWVLESDNPCPDCRFLHRISPFTTDTIPTTPKAGATRCLANCYCRLRVVNAKNNAELEKIRRRHGTASKVIKRLERNRKS